MTAETAAILVAAIAPTLTALAAFIVSVRNGRSSRERGKTVVQKVEAVQTVVQKNDLTTDQIHVLVDGNLTAVLAAMASNERQQNDRIGLLEKHLLAKIAGDSE